MGPKHISSQGTVEGDAIGAGQDVDLAGNILGNVRTAGANVNLSGQIGKNVTVFGGAITLARNSVVNGNVTAYGGKINLDGKVKGNVLAVGIVLCSAESFSVMSTINSSSKRKPRFDHVPGESKLTVLPGTIIHGTLKFGGANADIQEGAKISDFQWDKSKMTAPDKQKREVYYYLWKLVRLLVTTAFYFLIGLMLFRLFPTFFGRAAAFVTEKPWNAIGGGLITVFSTIVVAIVCVVLLIFSLLMSPVFGIVSSITAIGFYALRVLSGNNTGCRLAGNIGAQRKTSDIQVWYRPDHAQRELVFSDDIRQAACNRPCFSCSGLCCKIWSCFAGRRSLVACNKGNIPGGKKEERFE